MKAYLVIFSLFGVLLQIETAYAEDNDELATAARNLCEEKAYLEALKNHLTSAAAQKTEDARTAASLARMWQIVANTAGTTEDKCLFLALSIYADKIAATNAAVAKTANSAVLAAAQAISEQIGLIDSVEVFAKLTFTLPGSFIAGTEATARNFPLTKGTEGPALCNAVTDVKTIGAKNKEPAYEKLHTVKLTPRESLLSWLNGATTKITGLQSCNKLDGAAANYAANMGSCSYNSGGTVTTVINRATSTYAGTDKKLFSTTRQAKTCTETKLTDSTNKDKTKDLMHLLCEALKSIDAKTSNPKDLSGTTLENDHDTLTIIRNCNPQFQAIADIGTGDETKTLKKYVNEAYGDDSAKFNEKFIKRLSQIKPTVRKDKTTDATKSVEELAGTVDAAAAAAHAEGERIKREIEAEKKSKSATVDSKKAEDCQGEKDETKCNNKDGCEYKNGECKAKEGVKAENDGKKNTTGKVLLRLKPFFFLAEM
uniref:Variant surface glycoprotein 1125.1098 n=1 Tax=Trypanosoma brucei TaxID=5691 RepID=A0A1J0R6A2_9TRYP|nr:variant surface glycoprotein 1125.1098 [Trypanosoma brucei]